MKAANGCFIWVGFLAVVVGVVYFWVHSVDISAYEKAVKLSNSKKHPKEQMEPINAYLVDRPNGARKAEAERLLEKLEKKLKDSVEQTNTLALAIKDIKHNFTPSNGDALRTALEECPLAAKREEAEELLAMFDRDLTLVVNPGSRREVTVNIIPNTSTTKQLADELTLACKEARRWKKAYFRTNITHKLSDGIRKSWRKEQAKIRSRINDLSRHAIITRKINGEASFKLKPKSYFVTAHYSRIQHEQLANSWWILHSSPIRDQKITLSYHVSHEKYNHRAELGGRDSLYLGF